MLVTKTLPHDVAILVFVPYFSRLSFLFNLASGPRSSSHKQILYGRVKHLPSSIRLMLFAPGQGPSAFLFLITEVYYSNMVVRVVFIDGVASRWDISWFFNKSKGMLFLLIEIIYTVY